MEYRHAYVSLIETCFTERFALVGKWQATGKPHYTLVKLMQNSVNSIEKTATVSCFTYAIIQLVQQDFSGNSWKTCVWDFVHII